MHMHICIHMYIYIYLLILIYVGTELVHGLEGLEQVQSKRFSTSSQQPKCDFHAF